MPKILRFVHRCKVQRLQSAMEYLVTYGWAILILAVVLSALYLLGVFNPSDYAPTSTCTLPAQLGCLSTKLATNGNMLVSIGQLMAPTITITSIGCNTKGTVSNMITYGLPLTLAYGSNATIMAQCYENGNVVTRAIGGLYAGYLIIDYTNPSVGIPHTAVGKLQVKASTLGVSTSTTSTSTSTTSTSTVATTSTTTTTTSVTSTSASTSTSTAQTTSVSHQQ